MNFVAIPKNASTSIASALGIWHEHKRASETPGPRFAVVRHPATRARSAYRFARTHHSSRAKRCLGDARTFAQFLARDNELTRPQSWWLDAEVDLLLRFETLNADFERAFGTRLPVMNASTGDDEECGELIAERYAEDFKRFGYVV